MPTLDTGTCQLCGQPGSLELATEDQLNRALIWKRQRHLGGKLIQQILPDLSDGAREQIMTGSHEVCFDSAFPEEEEEDPNPWPLPGEEEPPSFKCPVCGAVSFNSTDVAEGYCGACHDWTGR